MTKIQLQEKLILKKKYMQAKSFDGPRAYCLDLAFIHNISPHHKFNITRVLSKNKQSKQELYKKMSQLREICTSITNNIRQVIVPNNFVLTIQFLFRLYHAIFFSNI